MEKISRAIDQCKTLEDFKDLVALRNQWIDFKDFYDTYSKMREGERFIMKFTDAAAELYAEYKSKQAIKDYKNLVKNGK